MIFNDKNDHDEKTLHTYEFINKVSKIVNNSTRIPRTVQKKVSYLQKESFFVV